ncbi:MAG: sigma-70 family RNA polymerase sigma factor [Butyrivibrio sp.]|uniref:RNA polymerase sigma-70 factor, ECF subfamily n=1 Tax=Butyrivibrio hungatei TaxID=185008 RepID=A0A1G5DF74_9FIRM|nr:MULTISPECIES: sigma-70 family RNA polymerase sigma factor [Butyrivibrio]MBR4357984.1 sigma-70 family RNA polymerase sigma factor [Butyrivibrio sp.]SCY13040.1 RNA polymerase sigma-70 factor, ECF subfamily [Butyrivibrio hungatei]
MRIPVQELVEMYKDNIYAAAFNICKSAADAEDVVQDTFLQYYMTKKEFDDEKHIRYWILRVAINKAKNIQSSFRRKNEMSLEDYVETLTFETPESRELFEEVMKLPEKYRVVIHLFYYEDYSVKEIAKILRTTESSVKVRLSRGRAKLKDALKEEWEDEQ